MTQNEYRTALRNLSNTQYEAMTVMEKHGHFVRLEGGFWTYPDAKIMGAVPGWRGDCAVPEWYCGVSTLRSLQKRGLVELRESDKICERLLID